MQLFRDYSLKGDKIMKFFVRAFALSLFVAGASAAVVSSHANVVNATPSHVAGVSAFPVPGSCNCGVK
jgi:hypothetical protein